MKSDNKMKNLALKNSIENTERWNLCANIFKKSVIYVFVFLYPTDGAIFLTLLWT